MSDSLPRVQHELETLASTLRDGQQVAYSEFRSRHLENQVRQPLFSISTIDTATLSDADAITVAGTVNELIEKLAAAGLLEIT